MNFKDMSIAELLTLNKAICEAISQKRSAEAAVKVTQLNVGDRVRYIGSPRSPAFNATVNKVLRVNVDVTADNGKPWRINASMLTKIQ